MNTAFAALHYILFQLSLLKAIQVNNDWDSIWSLNKRVVSELSLCSSIFLQDLTAVSLVDPKPNLTIFTDAFLVGWGDSLSSGDITSGKWNSSDLNKHINYP